MSVESRFIRRTLESEGNRMLRNQGAEIRFRTHSLSGQLLDERRISVRAGEDMSGELVFRHPIYERFLDIRPASGKKRSRFRIHNRFVYGMMYAVADELMFGLTDEVREELRMLGQ